ncbi:protein SUPPRESSOR OF QUENCHING 1, chloroplastic isoform X2 [Abrus precatorius]|uniref:Protein SUPPRESSOR OF QUENCHING 1, chloroplastic isoform X2 n=1 Tax=Abrus precatorius TaxID=3816 RepID=A0A8B8LAT1_ABRPR|nr:protein SUPPRESSOR OF QUENCHING 1, chloroplastic isoform X2 [Abrus precatorius]
MAMAFETSRFCLSRPTTSTHFFFSSNLKPLKPISLPSRFFHCRSKRLVLMPRLVVKACAVNVEEKNVASGKGGEAWGNVSAVLFDMDGVLCNSEEPSRRAAVDVFAEMGVQVTVEDFVPFMGTGEANFLGGVASVKGVNGFDPDAAKKRFFEIYLDKYAKPDSGIGFPGALELISQCKSKGLKVAVASSADRIKVDANLAAAGLPLSLFDAIVSADAFENLKPAPDIFLAASRILNVPPSECIVIEDALAGVLAAKAAQMRCIAVRTTLSDEALESADPALIRDDIGNVSLDDILSGGSIGYNKRMQGSETLNNSPQSSSDVLAAKTTGEHNGIFSTGGFQGSRRDILRFGSLGIAISCLVFTLSNWKAMQYASPKAVWNQLFGVTQPPIDNSRYDRIQQFVNYISDLESRGNMQIVPEFPSKLDWFNTAPLQFRRDLKGKVVLLDFWTYCCINCMHVLPDLDVLEKKYKDMPFVVVGVHSAKFDNEKDSEAIRNAVLRYGITHPVVNDGDMYLWRKLGVNSWPTFAIVSPNGKLLAQLAGEGHRKDLDDFVEAALLFYGKENMLDKTPITLSLEKDNDPRLLTSPLKFPGKLAIDVLNNRLFISDSNHNRIVVTDLDGNFILQIGSSGEEGLQDGSFDDATFNRPQGLAYNAKKNILYVADTENHALREIDFVNEKVRTLAGNGTKGTDYIGGGKGDTQLLNSPWDVCFHPFEEKIYIAMAGQHQIWEHNLLDATTRAFSGDGYERNLNGSSSSSTSFAQPSGLSLSQDLMEIYIADSESSSIRALDLKTGGSQLLAGGDPIFPENLFKFGDQDGIGSNILLQHPLGIMCGSDGEVYITDSYNHKIKKLDPTSKRVSTIAGTGKAGFKDGTAVKAQLSEPSGIVEGKNGRLFIADTNNSLIRYLDLNTGEIELRTLELKGIQPPKPKSRSFKRLRRRPSADTVPITVDAISSNEGNLSIQISLPNEYHFSKEARSRFSVDIEPEDAVNIDPVDGLLSPEGSATLHFKRSSNTASIGRINCKIYFCKEDEVCLYQSVLFEVPFRVGASNSASPDVTLAHFVKPKTSTNSLLQPVVP